MITLKKIVVKYRDHYIKSKTKFLNVLKNSNNIEGNHKKEHLFGSMKNLKLEQE